MTTHRSERRIWEVKTREGKPTGPRKIARGDVNQLLGQLEVEQRLRVGPVIPGPSHAGTAKCLIDSRETRRLVS